MKERYSWISVNIHEAALKNPPNQIAKSGKKSFTQGESVLGPLDAAAAVTDDAADDGPPALRHKRVLGGHDDVHQKSIYTSKGQNISKKEFFRIE